MSWAMAFTNVPTYVTDLILGISDNKMIILLVMNILLLVVGTFMDATPAILIFMLVQSTITEIKNPYGGYPILSLFLYGWSIIGIGVIGALLLAKRPWKDKQI